MPAPKLAIYQILARSISENGTEVVRVLCRTRHLGAHEDAIERVLAIGETLPKLHPGNLAGSRRVRVAAVTDNWDPATCPASCAHLKVGDSWPSAVEASEALGYRRHTLLQLFCRARKKAKGVDAPIEVRGYILELEAKETVKD